MPETADLMTARAASNLQTEIEIAQQTSRGRREHASSVVLEQLRVDRTTPAAAGGVRAVMADSSAVAASACANRE